MRAVLIALVAIAASAVASVSNAPPPMQDQGAQIASLADTIKEYTGAINKTIDIFPSNGTVAQREAAAAAVAPSLHAITEALNDATTSLAKRELQSSNDLVLDILLSVQIVVWEIAGALQSTIVKLGLAPLFLSLAPLLLALVGFIQFVDTIAGGTLAAVKVIVDSLLGSVATGVLRFL